MSAQLTLAPRSYLYVTRPASSPSFVPFALNAASTVEFVVKKYTSPPFAAARVSLFTYVTSTKEYSSAIIARPSKVTLGSLPAGVTLRPGTVSSNTDAEAAVSSSAAFAAVSTTIPVLSSYTATSSIFSPFVPETLVTNLPVALFFQPSTE